jgi:hypothetical protein
MLVKPVYGWGAALVGAFLCIPAKPSDGSRVLTRERCKEEFLNAAIEGGVSIKQSAASFPFSHGLHICEQHAQHVLTRNLRSQFSASHISHNPPNHRFVPQMTIGKSTWRTL